MRQVEKYYQIYIPALNKGLTFKRENNIAFVRLKDEDVAELGSNNLKAAFPADWTPMHIRSRVLLSEAYWEIRANIKEWE